MLDVARLRSLLDTREAYLATVEAAKRDMTAASTRQNDARELLRDVEQRLNAAIPDDLPRLVKAAELLRELLPHVDLGAVGHHAVTGCRCAMCDAVALVGLPLKAVAAAAPARDGAALLREWMTREGRSSRQVAEHLGIYRDGNFDAALVTRWHVCVEAPNSDHRARLECLTGGAVPASSWEGR